jgi:DNA gyrase/topoisomerase IV subunit A
MLRPDLSHLNPEVIAYIEALERRIAELEGGRRTPTRPADERPTTPLIASEPATTVSLVTVSRKGLAKRTLRHLYERQHRGGVGNTDLELPEDDAHAFLLTLEETSSLLLFTSRARVFRFPLDRLEPAPVRGEGRNLLDRLPVEPDEQLVAALPTRATGSVILASASGGIRALRHHLFGEHLRPGTAMYNYAEFGPLAAVCWSPSDGGDLLMVSQAGMAIRFSEKLVPPQGGWGMRLGSGDAIRAVQPVTDESEVFLLAGDGRGTLRAMSSFAANKSLGGSGKIAMRADRVADALVVTRDEDLFCLSEAGKVIRFSAAEVPVTDAPVQGVTCMDVRFTQLVKAARSTPTS